MLPPYYRCKPYFGEVRAFNIKANQCCTRFRTVKGVNQKLNTCLNCKLGVCLVESSQWVKCVCGEEILFTVNLEEMMVRIRKHVKTCRYQEYNCNTKILILFLQAKKLMTEEKKI
jgi:hypothetical protein